MRVPSKLPRESALDPADWEEFRLLAHQTLDLCIDHLRGSRERPVWQPVPEEVAAGFRALPEQGSDLAEVLADFEQKILPYSTGNTHPRFFGWVHGTGTAVGMLAEMCSAGMNSNCGGRDHGAVYVERGVIEWCRTIFGFPESASGVLTSSTSVATVIALAAARLWAAPDSRQAGMSSAPRLVGYASAETHSAVVKAMELLGLGSEGLRRIPVNPTFAMDLAALRRAIAEDRSTGSVPFCVVATAGTVNTGAFDEIDAIADICAEEKLWLHVDGAFGAWAALADAPWQKLTAGLHRADSLAFDFHKWMYVPYDCGCVLVRDEALHRAAFASRPDYLAPTALGLAGGDPWYCDYGIDLSRGFRALKVWFTLREFGIARLGAKISENCRQARRMAELVQQSDDLELLAPAPLNICCFRYAPAEIPEHQLNRLNEAIMVALQDVGMAVLSTTKIGSRLGLRAAIVNHRTRFEDIDQTIEAVQRTGRLLCASGISAN